MLAIFLASFRLDFLLHIDLKFQMPMVLLFIGCISARLSKAKFLLVANAVLLQSIEGFEQFAGVDALVLVLMVAASGILVHGLLVCILLLKFNSIVGKLSRTNIL